MVPCSLHLALRFSPSPPRASGSFLSRQLLLQLQFRTGGVDWDGALARSLSPFGGMHAFVPSRSGTKADSIVARYARCGDYWFCGIGEETLVLKFHSGVATLSASTSDPSASLRMLRSTKTFTRSACNSFCVSSFYLIQIEWIMEDVLLYEQETFNGTTYLRLAISCIDKRILK